MMYVMTSVAGLAALAGVAMAQTIEDRLLYPGAALPGGAPALGDFDGDGDVDLVSAGLRLYVYVNDGDALREPVPDMSAPGFSLATGDLDLDGDLDLVSTAPSGLIIGLNDGSGRFERTTALLGNVFEVDLADLNGDGVLDAIWISRDISGDELVTALGVGDGTFETPAVRYALDGSPSAVLVADVDGDGNADALTGDGLGDALTLFAGDGAGALEWVDAFTVGVGPADLAFVDVDGDGDRDVLAATSAGLSLLRNLGGGAFADAERFGAPGPVAALAVGDIDGDGDPDVVRIASEFSEGASASVMINDGAGLFSARPPVTLGTSAGSAVLVDLDGDGGLDLATRGSWMSTLLNDGAGNLQGPMTLGTPDFVRDVAAADFDGDGLADLAAVNRPDLSVVSLHLALPGGGFAEPALFPCGSDPLGIAVADFDGDGRPDVVTGNFFASSATALLNTGGAFGPPITIPSGGFPYDVDASDANGDGLADVIVPSWSASTVTVALGNGDGSFQPGQARAAGRQTRSAAFADANGDGVPDIVTANGGDAAQSVLLGMGGGAFAPATPVDLGAVGGQDDLTVGDLDQDGFDDAVFANNESGGVRIAYGGPDGLGSPELIVIDGHGGRPAIGDVDGDGLADLVLPDQLGGSVYVMPGLGGRALGEPRRFTAGEGAASVSIADFDGDGLADLAIANEEGHSITVLLNRPAPCRPDLDADGELTIFDFLMFFNLFDDGDPIADFDGDGDGELTIFDFLAYQTAFEAGCE